MEWGDVWVCLTRFDGLIGWDVNERSHLRRQGELDKAILLDVSFGREGFAVKALLPAEY